MSCEGCEEGAYVIDALAKLLAEIAVIVNGVEPHDTSWSYHDLPEKVRALKQAQQQAQQPAAAVPEGYALVKVQHEERDGFWSFSDNEENFVGEECDTELDAIAAALDYYGDDLETVYVGQAKRIDKARLVRGDHIIELIGDAAGEEVGECAYDWPRISKDECAELERIVMGYVLSKSPAGFFTVENSREYTREQAEEMLAAANKENTNG